MTRIFRPRDGWGPDRQPAALSITFDNLGEAAWVENEMWDQPVGNHFTADFVPRLIETLGDVRATYFIEGINTELYPEAIRTWAAAGHEVGLHAWRHEAWHKTPAHRRIAILARSLAAMRSLGIEPIGFRPPGGALPDEAYREIADAGFAYVSDSGTPGIRQVAGLTVLPFAWRNVDSYITEPIAAPLRAMFGDADEAGTLDDWRRVLEQTLDDAIAEGGQRTVIFHPEFIGASDEKLAIVRWLIDRARAANVWIAAPADLVAFVTSEQRADARV